MRIFAQTQYPHDAEGVSNVLKILENTVQVYSGKHHFWPNSTSLREKTVILTSAIAGPRQITDVYLLGLCQQNGGTLVTLDTGITVAAIVSSHLDLLRLL